MNKPLVSIITPAYNHERFIRQCMESVRNQTWTEWEQIIVDDCSSDRTAEIVRSYGDPRIQLITNNTRNGIENLGDSYNKALAVAKGQYVAILEGDDYWPREKLARQIPAFEEDRVILVWGHMAYDYGDRIDEDQRTASLAERKRFSSSTERLLVANHIGPVTVIIRRSALDRIGGFYQVPGTVMVDYSTWLRLSATGEFRYVPSVSGYWRRHPGQITQVGWQAMVRSQIEIVQDFLLNHQSQRCGKPFNPKYCEGGIVFRQGCLEHLNGNRLGAIWHYVRALPRIHPSERRPVLKCLVKAIIGGRLSN